MRSIRSFLVATLVVATIAVGSGLSHDPAAGAASDPVRLSDTSRYLGTFVRKPCGDAVTGAAADTRALGAAAIYELAYEDDATTAQALLAREVSGQIDDAASPRDGAVVDPSTPLDSNDTVFAAQPWGPILLRFGDRLTPAALASLREHARLAVGYFIAHPVSVDYTNIHLLTSAEEVLLGDALGDARAQRVGMAGLAQWLTAVKKDGIHEFESPTYYTVDVDALEEGADFATDPQQRAGFARALDYVWREIAANVFVPKGRIAGAQSRSYDVLYGSDAPMDVKLRYAGLGGEVHDNAALRCLDVFSVLQDVGSYHLAREARAAAELTPRRVVQRWSNDPQATKETFVTDRFAIGSSNEDYNPTDRVASIDFAGGPRDLVPIRLLGDKTGYWYGPSPTVQPDGETKWSHVLTRPSSVQNDGLLLVLSDPDGTAAADGGPLTVNVLLPATHDVISVGSAPVAVTSALNVALHTSDTVSVSVGDTTAAVRVLRADASSGAPAPLALVTDAAGLRAGVVRVEALQAPSLPTQARDLRSVFLFDVASGPDAGECARSVAAARMTSTDDGTLWKVAVTVEGHVLESTYDRATHRSVDRRVDGVPIAVRDPLSINGRAIYP